MDAGASSVATELDARASLTSTKSDTLISFDIAGMDALASFAVSFKSFERGLGTRDRRGPSMHRWCTPSVSPAVEAERLDACAPARVHAIAIFERRGRFRGAGIVGGFRLGRVHPSGVRAKTGVGEADIDRLWVGMKFANLLEIGEVIGRLGTGPDVLLRSVGTRHLQDGTIA